MPTTIVPSLVTAVLAMLQARAVWGRVSAKVGLRRRLGAARLAPQQDRVDAYDQVEGGIFNKKANMAP
jgi:hypothetical protein